MVPEIQDFSKAEKLEKLGLTGDLIEVFKRKYCIYITPFTASGHPITFYKH